MVTSSQQTRYHNVFNLETDTSRTCRFQSVRLTENNRFEAVNLDYTPETIAASILKNIGTFDTALSVCYSIIAFMLVFNVACGYLSYKTFGVYGWSIYQIQGADIQKREILKRYYIFMTVMKMNIFFFLGIFAQLVIAIYFKVKVNTLDPVNVDGQPEDLERTRMRLWIFTIIGFLAALLYFVLGYVGMRRGSMILMGGFLFMMAAYMVAVFYFLVQANTDHDYSVTRIWLTVFTVFQVLLNVGTLVSAGFAMRDFSNGLGDLVKSVIVVKAPADPEQKPANENARMLLD
nr:hypothetical protein HK105_007870 [Polyrhizophydium stewartii]